MDPCYSENVRTACLPKKSSGLFTNEAVTVTGWGKSSDSSPGLNPTLRYYTGVTVMDNSDCNAVYGIITDGQLCIDSVGGHGVCNVSTNREKSAVWARLNYFYFVG